MAPVRWGETGGGGRGSGIYVSAGTLISCACAELAVASYILNPYNSLIQFQTYSTLRRLLRVDFEENHLVVNLALDKPKVVHKT